MYLKYLSSYVTFHYQLVFNRLISNLEICNIGRYENITPVYKRRFLIAKQYGSCDSDNGYLMVADSGATGGCHYDARGPHSAFYYSSLPTPQAFVGMYSKFYSNI